jgi:hypothetical protein
VACGYAARCGAVTQRSHGGHVTTRAHVARISRACARLLSVVAISGALCAELAHAETDLMSMRCARAHLLIVVVIGCVLRAELAHAGCRFVLPRRVMELSHGAHVMTSAVRCARSSRMRKRIS